jgi:acyl-coenzyme A thioesterase PaaI-like protein
MTEPDEAYFNTIPWCAELLNDPKYSVTATRSRRPKSDTEDILIFKTLNSNETVRYCLTLYKKPSPGDSWIEEVRVLVSLGSEMNGGPDMLHGGIAATIMDETLSNLMTLNNETHQEEEHPSSTSMVTARLDVSYFRPIKTPGTYLVIARCKEKVKGGRKLTLQAEIRNGEGVVLSRADSVWVRVPRIYGGKL